MTLSEELRAAHLRLSEVDLEFREIAREDPEFLSRSTFRVLESNRQLLKFKIQSWPTFIGQERLADFKRISVSICSLLKKVPEILFQSDPVKLCHLFGLDSPSMADVLLAQPNGIDGALSRGDFIDTPLGFKCIEFNFTPSLGGWETAILADMHLSVPPTSSFVKGRRISISYTDTVRLLFRHLMKEVENKGLLEARTLNIALVVSTDNTASMKAVASSYMNNEFRKFREERQNAVTGSLFVCHLNDFELRQGSIYLAGTPIHAMVKLDDYAITPQIFRSFKANKLALFNSPVSNMLSNKNNLALLSEHEDAEVLTPGERDLVKKHVPWSRWVGDREVCFKGRKVLLPDLLAAERERLVLKKASSYGGKDVAIGRFTPEQQWQEVIRKAVSETGWVAQEYVESRPYLYQAGEYGCSPHDLIWGPFIFGQTYAGAILRMQPQADEAAVNLSLTATEGILFEV